MAVKPSPSCLFWFRRDLRLHDNVGLSEALKAQRGVQCVFIFDTEILQKLSSRDFRVAFLHRRLTVLKAELQKKGSDLWVFHGKPIDIFTALVAQYPIAKIFCNHDYEPYAISRDQSIGQLANRNGIDFFTSKDQVIFEKNEILTDQLNPYTIYTPYKNKWLKLISKEHLKAAAVEKWDDHFFRSTSQKKMPSLSELGFVDYPEEFYPPLTVKSNLLKKYQNSRDFPGAMGTSHLGIHLRFGTISIRELVKQAQRHSEIFLNELIWRDFFMQILFHYPHVENQSFRPIYDRIAWRDSDDDFAKWREGKTGYPLVDAGMRELKATGYMHNRVRMVTASFLTKHLLIHWKKGERYFASQLLDYDLAANNGNWQWAAGSGCDAAPYFRIFNPTTQLKKFDPELTYVKKWVAEITTSQYPEPMISHEQARERCLREFSKVLKSKGKKNI